MRSLPTEIAASIVPVEPASSPLFPSGCARARLDQYLTVALADARSRVVAGAVTPSVDLDAFGRELAAYDFQMPQPLDEMLAWTITQLERGVVHTNHPRYFGLFNPSATFPAQCADRIAASFNPQLATFTTSPVPVAIEAHVIRSVARRAGFYSDSEGHFTTGGTEANYTALVCALTRANPDFARHGSRAFHGAPVCYISADSHLAWLKIAHQAGIGREAMHLVQTDGFGRMDSNALAAAVAADRADGRVPVMIVATAGTTGTGMIDPLDACGAVAREWGLWYHIDAAWGGALIASNRWQHVLAGIETADSITIDAHKWFATTMGCGMFITTQIGTLSNAFQVSTSYMPSNIPALDPYVTSVQWSRRFLGLRLFLSLATAGWSGYAHHVEQSIAMVALLKEQLVGRGWKIANASPLAVLCVEPRPGSRDVRSIVRGVLELGAGVGISCNVRGPRRHSHVRNEWRIKLRRHQPAGAGSRSQRVKPPTLIRTGVRNSEPHPECAAPSQYEPSR